MSVVATVRVPVTAFPPTRVLPADPSVSIRVDRLVTDDERITLIFWVDGDSDLVEWTLTRLGADTGAQAVTILDEVETRLLARATWGDGENDLLSRLATGDGTLLRARDGDEDCELVVQFPDDAGFDGFRDWCDRSLASMSITEVQRIEPDDQPHDREPSGSDLFIALTDALPGHTSPP